jgi:hypothetical protein
MPAIVATAKASSEREKATAKSSIQPKDNPLRPQTEEWTAGKNSSQGSRGAVGWYYSSKSKITEGAERFSPLHECGSSGSSPAAEKLRFLPKVSHTPKSNWPARPFVSQDLRCKTLGAAFV